MGLTKKPVKHKDMSYLRQILDISTNFDNYGLLFDYINKSKQTDQGRSGRLNQKEQESNGSSTVLVTVVGIAIVALVAVGILVTRKKLSTPKLNENELDNANVENAAADIEDSKTEEL